MDQFNTSFQGLLDNTDLSLKSALANPYVLVSLKVFLGLYAAFAAPNLPKNLALMMNSTVVRVLFASLIVYSTFKDPVLAILLAIIFIVTLQTADRYQLYDSSLSVTDPNGISWLPSAKNGAVVGKVLTDNVDDVLKQKLMVKEMLTTMKAEEEVNKANDVMDMEMIRRAKHDVITNLPPIHKPIQNITVITQPPPPPPPPPKVPKQTPSYPLSHYTRMAGQSVINTGSNVVNGVFTGGGHALEGVHSGVFRATSGAIDSSAVAGRTILDSTSHVGRGLSNSVGHVGSGVIGGVRSTTNGVINGVDQAGYGLVMGARNVKSGLVGGVSRLGDCLIDSAAEIAGGLLGGVKHISNGVLTGAETAGSGTLQGVRSIGGGVASGVQSVGSGVYNAGKNINSGVEETTYTLGHEVLGGIRNAGSGFKTGIVSVANPLNLAEHFENVPKPPQAGSTKDCSFVPYVNSQQLAWANDNNVPGANQQSVVKTFDNEHNPQGMNSDWVSAYNGAGYANY